jgi:hypothetical protein
MVKDSKKYASTGGWWFAQFDDGKPLTDKAKLKRCSDCHALNKDRDLVFTKYAPRYGNPLNNTNDLAPPFFPIGQGIRPSDSRRSAQDRARGLRRRRHT